MDALTGSGTLCLRPAAWDDRHAIRRLIADMGDHADVLDAPGWDVQLGAVLRSPACRAVVAVDAEAPERPLGYLEVHVRPGSLHAEREAWIAVAAVAPGQRDRGIGALLVRAADDAARALGCGVLVCESSDWRHDAHRFWKREGFFPMTPAARFRRPVLPASTNGRPGPASTFLDVAAEAAARVAGAIAAVPDDLPAHDRARAFDEAAEDAALAVLSTLGLPIVSEERGVVGRRPVGDEPWIALDPLDGTRNAVAGLAPFATAYGLVAGGRPLAGSVTDLTSGTCWSAIVGQGAWRDGRAVHVADDASEAAGLPRMLLGMPSMTGGTRLEAPDGFRRVRMSGATTVDLCRVADGSLDGYLATLRKVVHVHDLAGPWAVVLAAGGSILGEDGREPVLVPDTSVTYRLAAGAPSVVRRLLGTR